MSHLLMEDVYTYKSLDEYKSSIDITIAEILLTTENLVFANVARKSGVNEFVIRKFPELRGFILKQIMKHKNRHVINCRILKVVENLNRGKKNISFLTVLNKCKFSNELELEKEYIYKRIKEVIAENIKNFKI